MESLVLYKAIERAIMKNHEDFSAYGDLFDLCVSEEKNDKQLAHEYSAKLRQHISRELKSTEQVQEFYDLYKKTLLFDAPHSFDAYMLYLEINRKPSERFYQPRRKILKPLIDALQDLADGNLDELFLSMPPRVGKLLADSTPVLTTKGWKNHGDLKVGDMVFSPEGYPVPVIGVLPKYHTTHTITFSNGERIKCHYNHEWKVIDRQKNTWTEEIFETKNMLKYDNSNLYPVGKRGHRYRFMLPLRKPIEGVEQELFVKPYTLGAWLGDGSNMKPCVTGIDEEIFESIKADGYTEDHRYVHKTTGVTTCVFNGISEGLRKYGMCSWKERTEKHIPEVYLCSPIEDRLELLAGLLDTDGSLTKKENRYHFSTADVELKNTFIELIATFGWRTSVKEVEPHVSSSGICGRKKYWDISFNPDIYIPCRLKRKQLENFSKQRRISIVKIEESEHERGNCITVFGGMYCVGKKMIPTHNTSMVLFFTTWLMGKDTEKTNLYSAFSANITNMFYSGILEIIKDKVTYNYSTIFPYATIPDGGTNAQETTIDLGRKKKYHTMTCRSLYGTLNGSCDCNGILIADDLLSGIEEALSPDRLAKAWFLTDNNLLPRAKENAKILWVGTRWSINDPIGKRLDIVESNPNFANRRIKVINVPALNDNDESNFEYDYGVGFSTEFYHQRRSSFEKNNDQASFFAQYMGQPIERAATVFNPQDMRYFNGELPDGKPDCVYMALDPSWGGGDYVASPIGVRYDDDIYIVDVVFTNADKTKSQPMVVEKLIKHNVTQLQIEANKTQASFGDEINKLLKDKNYRCLLTRKAADSRISKEQRIWESAPEIRENFIFLDSGYRDKDYNLFMQQVFSFKLEGKNKHDDAPDSLAMLSSMIYKSKRKVEVFQRPF